MKYQINTLLVRNPWLLLLCSIFYVVVLRMSIAECTNGFIDAVWVNGDLGICLNETTKGIVSQQTQEKMIKSIIRQSIQNRLYIPNTTAMRETWAFLHAPFTFKDVLTNLYKNQAFNEMTIRGSFHHIILNETSVFSKIIDITKNDFIHGFKGNMFDLRFHAHNMTKDYIFEKPFNKAAIHNMFSIASLQYHKPTISELEKHIIVHTLSVIKIKRLFPEQNDYIQILMQENVYNKYYQEVLSILNQH